MTAAALIAIYFVHLAAAVSPGPTALMAARVAMRDGMGRGVWLSIGFGIGACIWAVAALFGLALVFQVAPALMLVLKFGGAAYLIYLAYKMWAHARDPLDMTPPDAAAPQSRGNWAMVRQGILTMLANPKPAVFFGTIFLTFIPPEAPVWAYAVVLGMIFVNDAGWNIVVTRIFSLDRTRRGYLNLKTLIDRVFGGLLALLGLKLALT